MGDTKKRSVHHIAALCALIGMTLIAIQSFNAAGQQQPSQPTQQTAPTPRPVITMASPEEAAREMNNPRSKWFREAKYGLFIHWGLYAIPAGTWKGQQIPGIGEWIMNRAKIPVKEYEQLRSEERRVGKECRSRWAQDAGREDRTN